MPVRYNTMNPVEPNGSSDFRDLSDNTANLDLAMNAQALTWTNRIGVEQKSWPGILQQVNDFLVGTAFEPVPLIYVDGSELVVPSPSKLIQRDGNLYSVRLPANFPVTLSGNWASDEPLLTVRSDQALRQQLAQPLGSEMIGRGAGTVETALADLEERATVIEGDLSVSPGRLASITREFSVNDVSYRAGVSHRLVGKALFASTYDHFGQMDILPSGELYLIFRRSAAHAGGSDGNLMFSKLLPTGVWSTPVLIADFPGQDFRDAAGGTMSSGRIICASTIYETGDLHVFASDDYGVTWSLKQTILKGATDYRFAHGKGFHVGVKYVIPYYAATGGGTTYQLRWLETSDGGDTWVEGATVYSGSIAYNETAYLPMGGGAVLGVSRIGGGAGGKLRQFLSIDGGSTWVDQGDVTAQIGDSTDTLVSPSLSYVYSDGGSPYVAMFYTNRTSTGCYYRTIPVSKAIAGSSGWSSRTQVYSAPASSGYTSQVVIGGRRILGNVYRETSATQAGAYQFEVYLGDIPDFETEWTSVTASSVYTFAHGLQHAPRRVEIDFATSTNPATWNPVRPTYFNDGANKGSGAQLEVGPTNIRVGTGSAVWGTGYFGGFDNSTGNRVTSGYYRIRAWI
ncbi:glycoside hydrolase [Pseudomonas aeruginosa]|nr:glycoside hydrolase [Pseudomonas aeruginosa]MCT0158322.1 glycoside hydrolase [Pseudomonas aeruginosa]MCT0172798.1 glycoside hydrolase [Pseudomonas aeruginosa]MCT0178539.1 glycoside hydrolase [Pseudomonas aeruginosa]MCT0190309.1 glycoside hydrolase [Pseudomonas aeruginosa]